jgi:phosphatidate cytidylyltransferase
MHLKRWITGLIALPLLIGLVYAGGLAFTALVVAAGMVCLWEYHRIVFYPAEHAPAQLLRSLAFGTGLVILGATHADWLDLLLPVVACNLLAAALISIFFFEAGSEVVGLVQKQVQGIVYIPVLLSFLIRLRLSPDGMMWIFFLLSLIFAGDTVAFYVGSYAGRHKLCPAVSPGKTVEGALGGLAGSIVVGALFKYLFFAGLPWGTSFLFFLSVGVAGPIGDLFESELKRAAKVKDSGGILPGHGGFLDRVDALLFAAPVAYLFRMYVF